MATLARALWVCVALAALPSVAGAQSPASDVQSVANLDPLSALQQAEKLLGEAEFESALVSARAVVAALQPPPGTPRPQGEQRMRLARGYDIEAQCLFNLGRQKEMRDAMEQLLALVPGYQIDRSTAGPRMAEELERRRKATIGTIAVQCAPVACDSIEVDGDPQPPNAESRYLVPAGDRRVRLGRRNFQAQDLPTVRVMPGEVSTINATLQQVSRDVVLVTDPPGVSVVIDGREFSVSERGEAAGSKLVTIPELTPGDHVLVLTAPCWRRLEQSFDLFLDAQEPGPLDLGVLKLAEAHASIELAPTRAVGELFIDGKPAVVGANQVCPGARAVSWLVAGRRVWFSTADVREGESLALTLEPRPTLLLLAPSVLRGFPSDAWNTVVPTEDVSDLRSTVTRLIPRGNQLPIFPSWTRGKDTGLADRLRLVAPEADLAAVVVDALDPLQPATGVVLVDVRRGAWELTAWRGGDQAKPELLAELNQPWPLTQPLFGFDLIDDGTAALVGGVLPGSPATQAKLADGMTLRSIDGASTTPTAEIVQASKAEPMAPLTLSLSFGSQRIETQLAPVTTIAVPTPPALAGKSLLPQLARCEVLRVAGDPLQTMACAVHAGMILVALGRDEEAATTLDRAAIDVNADPAGDVRGTVAFELERLLRRTGRTDYAEEVHGRWIALVTARYGGRNGPPLRHAALTPSPQSR